LTFESQESKTAGGCETLPEPNPSQFPEDDNKAGGGFRDIPQFGSSDPNQPACQAAQPPSA
jgi:hypothetical protein